jgi:hypothetical protein
MARGVGGRSAETGVFGPEVVPTGFGVAAGSVVVVGSAFGAAAVPTAAGAVRLGLVAGCLAVFAAAPVTATAAAGTGVLALLVFNGFLVNALGELSWHGSADGWRLLTLAVAVTAGFTTGRAYRATSRWLRWRRCTLWITTQARQAAGRDDEEPRSPDALILHTRGIAHG